jgi:glycosyltransferase involved in cell wall biosynthesis
MRVLFDHQVFCIERRGGISRYHLELARELSSSGICKVDIFAGIHRSGIRSGPSGCGWQGLSLPWLPRTGYPLQVLSSAIVRALPAYRYDVFHQTYVHPVPAPVGAARVMTHHDCIYERYPERFRDSARIICARRRSLALADAVICVSTHARNELMEFHAVDPSRVHVVHHGMTELPKAGSQPPQPRPYVFHVGKREGYKDFMSVLRAWASTSAIWQNYDLVSFGGGPIRPEEARLLKEHPRLDGVRFIGGDDGVLSNWYAHAMVTVVPSHAEGFGFPVVEAMASGVPVAVSDATSLPEVAGGAARLVVVGNVDAWAQALMELLGDATLRQRQIAAGKLRAGEFTWKKCALATFAVYRQAIASSRMGRGPMPQDQLVAGR